MLIKIGVYLMNLITILYRVFWYNLYISICISFPYSFNDLHSILIFVQINDLNWTISITWYVEPFSFVQKKRIIIE